MVQVELFPIFYPSQFLGQALIVLQHFVRQLFEHDDLGKHGVEKPVQLTEK